MFRLPQRRSLETETAAVLQEEIRRGQWREWLPGERRLCEMLQVSRYTLRGALQQLQRAGLISSQLGVGHRIVLRPEKGNARPLVAQDVGLLLPGNLENLRPSHILWIDELRAMLAERGCRLHMFHGRKFSQRDPARALQRLLTQHAHKCWILLLSSESVQRWFMKQKVSCVVAGTCHAGIELPFCDLDHHASCRHAAGVLLGRGHRQVALLMPKLQHAGDIESEAGFTEGIRSSRDKSAAVAIGYHDGTPGGIAQTVKSLMQHKAAPTALLVLNPFHYLTVVTSLAKLGRRVPEHLSLISRDGEPFFPFLTPAPTYYAIDPRHFAKAVFASVLQLLEGNVITKPAVYLTPDYQPGHSVADLR